MGNILYNKKKTARKCLEGLQNTFYEKGEISLKESQQSQGPFEGPSRVQWRTKVGHGPLWGLYSPLIYFLALTSYKRSIFLETPAEKNVYLRLL